MVGSETGDYELMPQQEIEDLRREVNSLKKNSLIEGDKGRILIESIDRLAISINRLITILDDAQKDIIDEYQESKPAEKLNQLLDQNEMIAKALVAISDNLNSANGSSSMSSPRSILPTANNSMNSMQGMSGMNNSSNQNNSNMSNQNNQRTMLPPMPGMNSMQQQNMRGPSQMQMMQPSPMEDLPPMDAIGPLDSSSPGVPKKKFLGIM